MSTPQLPRDPLEELQTANEGLEDRVRLLESALDTVATLLSVNKTETNVNSAISFIRQTLSEKPV